MARKIFRMDIYRSHPTIKVAQYYYFFLRVTFGFLGAQGHAVFAICLEFPQKFPKPNTLQTALSDDKSLLNVWTTFLVIFNFSLYSYQTGLLSLRLISFLKIFLVYH